MKKILMISVVLFLTVQGVYSQEVGDDKDNEKDSVKKSFGVGFSASSISGVGPNFLFNISPKYQLKATAFYYERRTKQSHFHLSAEKKRIWSNGGIELRRILYMGEKSRSRGILYALAGASYWYKKNDAPLTPDSEFNRKFITVGTGFGMGILIRDRVMINLDLGMQYTNWIRDNEIYVGIGGGGGFSIMF